MRCDRCLNCCAPVMSENGIHYNCCLHPIAVKNCLLGKKDHFEEIVTNVSNMRMEPYKLDELSYVVISFDEMKEGDAHNA